MTARVHRPALLLAACACSLLAAGCEPRQRNNPFDPLNPQTNGTPSLLAAVAGDRMVTLSWDVGRFDDVGGVRLLRRVEQTETTVAEQAGAGSGRLADTDVQNGVTFSYRLEVVPGRSPSVFSASVPATPGGSRPWVADAAGYGVARLSPDGRNVLFRADPFREVLDLDMEPDGSFWVADYGNGEVVNYDPTGQPIRSWELEGANALALDRKGAGVWVGSFVLGVVALYQEDGSVVWADSTAGLVESVRAAPGGGVWVGARNGGLIRIEARQRDTRFSSIAWPVDLETAPDSSLWIVDRASARIYRLGFGEVTPQASPVVYQAPTDAADDGAGGVWVADPVRGGISHLNHAMQETAWFPLADATAVTWDPAGHRLWVCQADQGTMTVLQVGGVPEDFEVAAALDLGGRPSRVEGIWRP